LLSGWANPMAEAVDDPEAVAAPAGATAPGKPRLFAMLGPGLITGASDDDPSGIATYMQTGAALGYGASWTLLFSYPLMVAIQIVSGRIGRTTGEGIVGNLRKVCPLWLVYASILLLLVANVINIGADIGAMGESVQILIGGPPLLYVLGFGIICAVGQIFLTYKHYVSVLRWLSVALFAYVATLFFVKVDWTGLARGLFLPRLSSQSDYWTSIVAILGTTISPYLFFWQSSQEVEDTNAFPDRKPLKEAPHQAEAANARISSDTMVGMGFSNVIALAIMTTAAATLNASGVTNVQTAADAAKALEPLAGHLAEVIFALGILGTGLLAVPVLAGSSAYAAGEAFGWPIGLDRAPRQAKAFYGVIAAATLAGVLLNFSPIDPMKALFWSAVINGVVAVPIMVLTMIMASSPRVMGDHIVGGWIRAVGWIATAVMALAAAAMIALNLMSAD
jgi:NRAMP (natural resistance-associated macrophage protein)-like metal ion transporter